MNLAKLYGIKDYFIEINLTLLQLIKKIILDKILHWEGIL